MERTGLEWGEFHDSPRACLLLKARAGRWRMQVVVEVGTAVAGLAVAMAAGRLVLAGILAATFGRRL